MQDFAASACNLRRCCRRESGRAISIQCGFVDCSLRCTPPTAIGWRRRSWQISWLLPSLPLERHLHPSSHPLERHLKPVGLHPLQPVPSPARHPPRPSRLSPMDRLLQLHHQYQSHNHMAACQLARQCSQPLRRCGASKTRCILPILVTFYPDVHVLHTESVLTYMCVIPRV